MSFIIRFFTREKSVQKRLEGVLGKLKYAEFVLLSRLDGLPIVLISKKYKNPKILAALMATISSLSHRAISLIYSSDIKNIFFEFENSSLIIVIEQSLILSVLTQKLGKEHREKLLKDIEAIFDNIGKILV